jgi:hypothetical protein
MQDQLILHFLLKRTKWPLQLCWLVTSGTQEGRIAHHHTDATVLCKQSDLRSSAAHRGSTWFHLSRCRSALPLRLSKKDKNYFRNFQIFFGKVWLSKS